MNDNLALKTSILALMLMIGALLGYTYKPSTSVVTLDSKLIIRQLLVQNPSLIEKPQFIEAVSACLSEVVEDYAFKHHVLILPSQAAMAGNDDITPVIQATMQKRCFNHG